MNINFKKLSVFFLVIGVFRTIFSADLGLQVLEKIMYDARGSVSSKACLESFKEFCNWSVKTGQSQKYIDDGMRFFTNTFKRLPGIHSHMMIELLVHIRTSLSSYMHPLLATQSRYDATFSTHARMYQEFVKNHFMVGLSKNFDVFKKDPEHILNQLALELSAYYQEEKEIASLQTVVLKFVDTSVAKVLWSPHYPERSWESLQNIAQEVVNLMLADIIPDIADVDDCLWTLVQRYAIFIQLSGGLIESSHLEKMLADLDKPAMIFSLVNEQNSAMLSKVDYLKQVISDVRTPAKESVAV